MDMPDDTQLIFVGGLIALGVAYAIVQKATPAVATILNAPTAAGQAIGSGVFDAVAASPLLTSINNLLLPANAHITSTTAVPPVQVGAPSNYLTNVNGVLTLDANGALNAGAAVANMINAPATAP
jgi:hypothetical protein